MPVSRKSAIQEEVDKNWEEVKLSALKGGLAGHVPINKGVRFKTEMGPQFDPPQFDSSCKE